MSNIHKKTKSGVVLPAIDRSLEKLGQDINVARRARKISMADMAQRMGCSRGTLHRLEKGDAGISLNTLARALQVLGLLDRIAEIVDHSRDDIGLMMSQKTLPERIVRPRVSRATEKAHQDVVDHDEPEGW